MAKKIEVPAEVQEQIVTTYRAGDRSVGRIASDFGYSDNKVYEVLRGAGVVGQRDRHPGRKFTDEQEAAMVALYESGASLKEVGRRFECQYETAYKVLLRLGVQMRDPGARERQFTDEEVARMVELWRAGRSQAEIGAEFGLGQNVVSRVLRLRGSDYKTDARQASRERHGMWKGGRAKAGDGYVMVLVKPDDPIGGPMRNVQGYVLEHRLVMAQALGRPLLSSETVHHIDDKDRTDNRIENLQLRIGRHGKHAAFRCVDCGSANVQAVPLAPLP